MEFSFQSQGFVERFSYQPLEGAYDEMVSSEKLIRSDWKKVGHWMVEGGNEEIQRRSETVKRIIRENGITYNVYGDPRGQDRPWGVDAIPLVISSQEWAIISEGLIQRAKVVNAFLADAYGPQIFLKEGLLPPEIIHNNPSFLRACHGWKVPGDIYLHHYAVDLARRPDGSWCVISERTQAPSGAGYALENRVVLSRVHPDLFDESVVARLTDFFNTFRQTLISLAPVRRDNPRVVLLTPGPFHSSYFEHAFLARFLGYPLVEGADLTIRDNHVFLKTLGGLQPVDVILRRLDDDACDPLELRADSMHGVAGLVEAAMAGNVVITNALGSGLSETPALLCFMPRLCEYVTGEALKLPSVKTWWSGERRDIDALKSKMDRLVIKSAFPNGPSEPVFAGQLNATERERLLSKMRQDPGQYVAQECVTLSSAPYWSGKSLEPRPVIIRAYLVASGEGYQVMPGGLVRVASLQDPFLVSMQRGGGSKDLWILSDKPQKETSSKVNVTTRLTFRRNTGDLPSRVADNLFWLGRYAERAEDMARFLRVLIQRFTLESSGEMDRRLVLGVASQLGVVDSTDIWSTSGDRRKLLERELYRVVFDTGREGGIYQILSRLHRIASVVRDRLSLDAWAVLSQLEQEFACSPLRPGEVLTLLNRMILTLSAFSGMEMENMTRGQGWRFLDIGRRLERSMHITELIQAVLSQREGYSGGMYEMLLEVADSMMTYRSRYLSSVEPEPVLDLLIFDDLNPRSLVFQLIVLEGHVQGLARESSDSFPSAEQRLAQAALARLRLLDLSVLQQGGDASKALKEVNALLGDIQEDLPLISNAISSRYFSHSLRSSQIEGVRVKSRGAA